MSTRPSQQLATLAVKKILSTKNPRKKIITFLLILQISLLGMQAKHLIQQGDAAIEVMIWLLNQCFPVLERAKQLEDEDKKRGDRK
ncbi:MAG: hypothetical protein ACFKPT_30995 [Gloeotrichia echinulata GP01]